MEEKRITVAELAVLLDCSVHSIDNWYMWKRKNPNHPLAAMLPDFEKDPITGARYWKQSDAWRIDEFHRALPRGRNGIMGDVTQRTYRKHRKKELQRRRRNERAKIAMRKRREKEKNEQ